MIIEKLDTIDNVPGNKEHTVVRGSYPKILNDLMESSEQAIVIHCESPEDSIKKNVGLRNASATNKIPVKVWRRGSDVFVKKLEDK